MVGTGLDAIVCADWSKDPRRRDVYVARLADRRVSRLGHRAWTVGALLETARGESRGRAVLVGIDAPIGVPASIVEADPRGLPCRGSFPDWLCAAATERGFFDSCPEPSAWSPRRPFFSIPPGSGGLQRWLDRMTELGACGYRTVDVATVGKSPFIVSGIPGAVGSAARDVWRALAGFDSGRGFGIWPFDGDLESLTADGGIVLGEIYPRVGYGLALTAAPIGSRSRLGIAKTDPDRRAAALRCLLAQPWVGDLGVRLDDLDAARISDDAFDALLSASALLRCVLEGTPLESAGCHRFEGGILGLGSLNVALPETRIIPPVAPRVRGRDSPGRPIDP